MSGWDEIGTGSGSGVWVCASLDQGRDFTVSNHGLCMYVCMYVCRERERERERESPWPKPLSGIWNPRGVQRLGI